MAKRTRLTDADIARLAAERPGLPRDYLKYLRDAGWGTAPSGHMIYSGPIPPDEVYPELGDGDFRRVLIGDDTQGYCLGYDLASKRYGQFSDVGEWSSFDERFRLAAYLANAG